MGSPRRGRRVLLLVVVLLVAVAMGLAAGVYAWLVGPGRQGVTLRIRLIDSDGEAVPYAVVRVFLLTDGGPVLLAVVRAYRCGEAAVHVFVPRVLVGLSEVPYTLGGGVQRLIYASVNLEVFAVGLDPKGLLAGSRAFSVDPTYMRWPEDSVSVTVRMWKVPGSGSGRVGTGVAKITSSWQYTPVLKYSAWDRIRVWLNVSAGSKVEVESKSRVCGPGGCGVWRSTGSTQVTIDRRFVGGNLTGEVIRTLYMEFKYFDYTYCDPEFGVCEETVYAADTPADPGQYEYVDEVWDGRLPASPYAMYVLPGDMRIIPILGGYHWELFANISTYDGELITLGVTYARTPNPESLLYVKAGPGHGAVKIVALHGPEPGSYAVTYCRWVWHE